MEPARTRHGITIPVSHFLFERRTERNCGGVHRAAGCRETIFTADRDEGFSVEVVLPGGGVSPGLFEEQSQQSLHCDERFAETGSAEERVPGAIQRALRLTALTTWPR